MFLPKTNRKIIPRWRDFLTTAALGLLSPTSAVAEGQKLPRASEIEAGEAWRRKPTLWRALDFIGAAFVIGDTGDTDVQAAAKYLESRPGDCPLAARQLVAQILYPEQQGAAIAEPVVLGPESLHREIHTKRRRLNSEPRNAMLWTDLARLYTSVGLKDKARSAITNAFNLSSDNRFVVRSAARFFVHIGEHNAALSILRKTNLGEHDPWIVAAEIGVSSFASADSKFIKLGRRMPENKTFSEFTKRELASALATFDLGEGNSKGAKKLFKQSLVVPTENSLAQAEWASAQVGDAILHAKPQDVPRNYEAKTLHAYRLSNWDIALVNARGWLSDQPFSSRPAELLSYLYSSILERYQEAIEVLRFSQLSNPGDRGLTNNLAFALINVGETNEAESLLKSIDPTAIEDLATISLIATHGLFLFRSGQPVRGRELYLEAINLAKRKGNQHYTALAATHLAIEGLRSDTTTKIDSFRLATELAARDPEPDLKHIYARAKILAQAAGLNQDSRPDRR